MDETQELWSRWRRLLSEKSPDPLAVARLAGTFERYFDAIKTEAVRSARARGSSWDEVAESVGTTRQSAWERYRRLERLKAVDLDLPFFGSRGTRGHGQT